MEIKDFVDGRHTDVGHIDECVEFGSSDDVTVRLTGWALNPGCQLRRPGHSVVVVDEKRNIVAETPVFECRPDVAVYYHDPGLTQCGWTAFVSKAALPEGRHRLSAYTVDPDVLTAYRLKGAHSIVVDERKSRSFAKTEVARHPRYRPSTRAENQRLNLEEQVAGQTVLNSYPNLVLLELTAKCNLNCVMCHRYNTNLDGHIPDKLYDHVKTTLFPLAQRVFFSCRAGEPTLYPKWNQVVQDVVAYGPKGGLVTNATVLNDERIRQLVDANFAVRFSVDGATSRTFQYVRGFSLSTVARHIQEFVTYSRSSKKESTSTPLAWPPMTGVSFTPMMVNVRETPDMVDLIADWGVEALFVQKFNINNAYTSQHWSPETDPESMERIHDEAARRAESRSVTLVIADTVRYQPPSKSQRDPVPEMSHLGCTRPFTDAVINLDGGVLPCCLGAPPMGYLQYQSFDEIWNGETWRELRRGLAEGDPPAYCRKCHLLKGTTNGHKTTPLISIKSAITRLRGFSQRLSGG